MSTTQAKAKDVQSNGKPAKVDDGQAEKDTAIKQLESIVEHDQRALRTAELSVLDSRESLQRSKQALRALDPHNELVKPARRRAGNRSSEWKPSDRMRALVCDFMADGGHYTMAQVAEGAGISRSAADKVLRYLSNLDEPEVAVVDRIGAANIFALVS